MKNHFLNSVINLLIGLCFATLTPLIAESQIVSAPAGGSWSSAATWIGGSIPGAADNVIIASTVSVNGGFQCNNITIQSAAVLQNSPNNYYTLIVNGNLSNQGTIQNTSYEFTLIVKGNVSNSGSITNSTLNFTGNSNQQMAATQPVHVANLVRTAGSGRIRATTNLNFVGTAINLNSDTLEFTTGNTLTLDGGYLINGVIFKSALPAFQLTASNNAYVYALKIDAPQTLLNGTLLVQSSNNFKTNLINNATLKGHPSNYYTLTVDGNLTNNGVIQNGIYDFTINITGDITNNGTWQNTYTILNGSGAQHLAMTQPYSGAYFTKNLTAGRVKAITGLSFIGTQIDLQTDTLEFTSGNTITLNGGNLRNGVIFKSSLPAIQLTAGNNAYVYALKIDALQTELNGVLLINGSNNFKTNITNNDTLKSYPNNYYTLTVDGNLTNNGVIKNGIYDFTINITGDITNNGTWQNTYTILNGNGAQHLAMTQPYSGAYFAKNLTAGRAKAITGLSFIGTQIDLQADTLEFTTGNTIALDGGNLRNGVIFKSSLPAIQLTAGNNAYVFALKIDAPQTELNGSLLINSSNVFKTNITNNGILKNHPTNNYYLTINGNLTNNGVIQNGTYAFFIYISGNLSNNGTWQNYSTVLNGSSNQDMSMTLPFSGEFFEKTATAGLVRAISDLSFSSTKINFNIDTIRFTSGTSLTLTGGYFINCVLYKTAAPALQLTNNSNYFTNITIDALQSKLSGTLNIASGNTFKNDVTNNGALQNHPSNNYTLTINGNFTNNGSVKNSTYYFYMDISENITNNGSWKIYSTTLTGTNNRTLAFSKHFEGTYFTKSVAAGNLTANTDIIFDGTAVNLNGTLLTLPNNGYLSLLNGNLGNAIIAGNNIHFNTLAGYCFNTQFSTNVTLHGVFQARYGISFNGSVINQGTLRSYSDNNYSSTVSGALVNNGSISNGYYSLTLTILGNITNNGTWTNYQTILDGVADQHIYLNSTINGQLLLDANNAGSGNWFGPSGTLVGNSNFSGTTGQVLTFVNPVTSAFAGQYYRTGSGGNSRYIYINTPANPARLLTMNFLLEGLYLSNGVMRASLDGAANPVFGTTIADQVSIELHDNTNFSNILFTREGALLGTDGTVSFNVPGNFSGNYYLAIRHRSGIVTVSAAPVSFNTPTVNYSFNQLAKAYGNNLAQTLDGHFALYGGDVNQDGNVDIADMTPVDNESAEFAVGYRNPDTNGDGIIDISDMTIIDNNSSNFISTRHP